MTSFAVPFTACTEREIDIIKNHTNIKAIRLSEYKDKYDFSIPNDDYHYKFNAFHDEPDLYEHIKIFSENTLDKSIFIIVGHSYEFEVKNDWGKIENLLIYLKNNKKIVVLTLKDAVNKIFGQKESAT